MVQVTAYALCPVGAKRGLIIMIMMTLCLTSDILSICFVYKSYNSVKELWMLKCVARQTTKKATDD